MEIPLHKYHVTPLAGLDLRMKAVPSRISAMAFNLWSAVVFIRELL